MASVTTGAQNQTSAPNQQMEAIRFLIARISNFGLDQAWAGATTAAAQAHVLATWNFKTTSAIIQQMAANPQVKQALTGYLPNAAATQFASDLKSNSGLTQDWLNALQAGVSGSGTVNEAALNAFLSGRGYGCTYQQVAAALCQLQRTSISWWAGLYTTVVNDNASATGIQPAANSGSQAGPSVLIADSGTMQINGMTVGSPSMDNGYLNCGSTSGGPPAYPAASLLMTLTTPTSGSTNGTVCGFSGTIQPTFGASIRVTGTLAPPAASNSNSGGDTDTSVGGYILEGLNWLWNQFVGFVEGQILMFLAKTLFRGLARAYNWIVESSVKSVTDSMRPALEALTKARGNLQSEGEDDGDDAGGDEAGGDEAESSAPESPTPESSTPESSASESSTSQSSASESSTAESSTTESAASDTGDLATDTGTLSSDVSSGVSSVASDVSTAAEVGEDVSTGAEILSDLGEAAEFLPLLAL